MAPLDDQKFNRLKFFLKEDGNALSVAVDLIFLSHLIDTMDGSDMERSIKDIKRLFKALVITDKTDNPFLVVHGAQINPIIALAFMSWLDGLVLNKGENGDKFKAMCIRNDTLKVIRHMMLLIGGPEWSEEQGPQFWREFGPNA